MHKPPIADFQDKVILLLRTLETDQKGGFIEKWEKLGEHWVSLIPKNTSFSEGAKAIYHLTFRGSLMLEHVYVPHLKILWKEKEFRSISVPFYLRKFHLTTFLIQAFP